MGGFFGCACRTECIYDFFYGADGVSQLEPQLQENVEILYEYGAREIHMRIACPYLICPCDFLKFSTSRSPLDLAGRKRIFKMEGADAGDFSE